ncbi:MAG: peptide chain release factor 1 [Candidatus Lernaella stagnicola]|nr:peptide chain release factor 1 [Candidatus Lernaella stagnicola]
MFAKLADVDARYVELTNMLADPEIYGDQAKFAKFNKERVDLEEVVEVYRKYKNFVEQRDGAQEMLEEEDDAEIREMAKHELLELDEKIDDLTERLKLLLLPKDPYDDKNTLLEIRAGTGGEEAALFAGDLFRMYSRYAEQRRWKVEILSSHATGLGGFKEIICQISGDKVYSRLKYESGVHRVQRVPETEAQGRVHTSAVTVAILPEPDEVDVRIPESDLRFDVYRSSGPGGQSVNTTDSAVRVTHEPTGLVVTCQDEKSQHKNKARALMILKARLLDMRRAEQEAKMSAERRSQVGTGDRSERIRTYNFPQNRLTDHRIGLTIYALDRIMEGNMDQVIDSTAAHFQAEALKKTSAD